MGVTYIIALILFAIAYIIKANCLINWGRKKGNWGWEYPEDMDEPFKLPLFIYLLAALAFLVPIINVVCGALSIVFFIVHLSCGYIPTDEPHDPKIYIKSPIIDKLKQEF